MVSRTLEATQESFVLICLGARTIKDNDRSHRFQRLTRSDAPVATAEGEHQLKETSFAAPAKEGALSDTLASPLSRLALGDVSPRPSSCLDEDEATLASMASPRSVMSDEVRFYVVLLACLKSFLSCSQCWFGAVP